MPVCLRSLFVWFFLLTGCSAGAHELQPGFLDLTETATDDYRVIWKLPVSLGRPAAMIPVFPPECALIGEPRAEAQAQVWTWTAAIHCAGGLSERTIGIDGLEAFSSDVLLRVMRFDGRGETRLLKPEQPFLRLQAASAAPELWTYLRLGVLHIALGVDHLLFVFGLMLIVGQRWMLFKTITGFTIAHSITLAIATLGRVTVPAEPLNAVIALSILFLAPEIVRQWRGETSLTLRYPWFAALLFGLLHGFGFASGLAELGIPQNEIPHALLLFNLGVELGQLGFVLLVLLLLWSYRTLNIGWSVWMLRLPAYVLGSLGAYWTIQRTLMMFSIRW